VTLMQAGASARAIVDAQAIHPTLAEGVRASSCACRVTPRLNSPLCSRSASVSIRATRQPHLQTPSLTNLSHGCHGCFMRWAVASCALLPLEEIGSPAGTWSSTTSLTPPTARSPRCRPPQERKNSPVLQLQHELFEALQFRSGMPMVAAPVVAAVRRARARRLSRFWHGA
jgi:hypothetical protein